MSEKSISVAFRQVGYGYSKKAGKDPVYKVSFKSSEGHTLTLVGDSRAIYERFPEGSKVDVKIGQAQQMLNEFENPEDE
jgi:hypothetical protein